jgi:polyisoprenyl-phosphate glycosyltransferase
MAPHPIFLSLVCVLRNQQDTQEAILRGLQDAVAGLVTDYEIVVVDNASTDHSVAGLRQLTGTHGLPNLQVYALTKEVDDDTASWVGLENALGDFVAVIDPQVDDIAFLPQMLEQAVTGSDVVFARDTTPHRQPALYRTASWLFDRAYHWFNGVYLVDEAPHYRVVSRRVVNFILQHPQPALAYRHLPATGGFHKTRLDYTGPPRAARHKPLGDSVDRGMRLLVSTTRAPMRLVTSLSLFGAFANILYSVYVVAVALFKPDVAPGWVSLSLQQSGMFFLLSLVLLVLGEYILNMVSKSGDGPLYCIGQEFTSARMTRASRLNVEEVALRRAASATSASPAPVALPN